MADWKGRSGDGSEGRYTPDEVERNRALADTFDGAVRAFRVKEWLAGATDRASRPTLDELRAEGYDVVKVEP